MAEPDKRLKFWLQEEEVSLSTKHSWKGARIRGRSHKAAGTLKIRQESMKEYTREYSV